MHREQVINDIQYFFYDPCARSIQRPPLNYYYFNFNINGVNPDYYSGFLPSGDIKINISRNDHIGFTLCGYVYLCLKFLKQVTYVNDELVGYNSLLLNSGDEEGQFYFIKISLFNEDERVICNNH